MILYKGNPIVYRYTGSNTIAEESANERIALER